VSFESTERGMIKVRYWIGVASREHVRLGVKGGFAQFNHGKLAPARRPSQGDWVIYYSPKLKFGEAQPCRKFVAIGQNKTKWGAAFSFGFFEISRADFTAIAKRMLPQRLADALFSLFRILSTR